MKTKVKKTLIFDRKELATILAALDNSDGQNFPPTIPKAKNIEAQDLEKDCLTLAKQIRNALRSDSNRPSFMHKEIE